MVNDFSNTTILLVDDSKSNIDILIEILASDYEVRVALNGETALKNAFKSPPDIILLDIMMPGIDGYEVCKRLKENKKTENIPIIFLTAMTDARDEEKGLDLGAIDFITKPFNPKLVKARVNNHIELKRYRDHLEALVLEKTRDMKIAQDAAIISMAIIAECRDTETGEHIKRTQRYVNILSEYLKYKFKVLREPGAIDLFTKSAPLHDIGKVGIPDIILHKPGKLTEKEFDEMKKHTILGHDSLLEVEKILGKNSFLQIAREITLYHHEKWDGTGYPRGLKETEIPLPARIMAVADAYDAIISKRVYKKPLNHEEAIEIIINERGKHFDPNVVDAFLALEKEFFKVYEKGINTV